MAFDHVSLNKGSASSCLYLVIVSLVTGWTTPVATSSSAWGDALISVLLSSSRNTFPMNRFNAPPPWLCLLAED